MAGGTVDGAVMNADNGVGRRRNVRIGLRAAIARSRSMRMVSVRTGSGVGVAVTVRGEVPQRELLAVRRHLERWLSSLLLVPSALPNSERIVR
jgi:hypothetical protein